MLKDQQSSYDESDDSASSEYINFSMFLEILKRKDFVPTLIPVHRAMAIFKRTAQFRVRRDGSRTKEKVLSEDQV